MEGGETMRNVRHTATERVDEPEPVMNPPLPDELVEDIVAMMPFPSIFKARCLSKLWLVRLSSISSLDDEEEKQLASAFQKNVAKRCSNWATFCPVIIFGECIRGYNKASGIWQTLPPLPFRHHTCSSSSSERFFGQMEGALLTLGSHEPKCMKHLRVGNMLTGKWKQLPASPEACQAGLPIIQLVGNRKLGTYKVIIVSQNFKFQVRRRQISPESFIHVYDSKSETWSTQSIDTAVHLSGSFVYYSGVFYILSWSRRYPRSCLNFEQKVQYHTRSLLAINEEGGQSKEIELWFERRIEGLERRLVVCNDDLFMIYMEHDCTVIVLRIDPESSKVEEVARCASSSLIRSDRFNIPVSAQVTCIFYTEHSSCCHCMREKNRRQLLTESRAESTIDGLVLTYNQDRDQWDFFSFPRPAHLIWTKIRFTSTCSEEPHCLAVHHEGVERDCSSCLEFLFSTLGRHTDIRT